MGCCGNTKKPDQSAVGERRDGDILARPKSLSTQKMVGVFSGRRYGRINNKYSVWVDPRDFYGMTNTWEQVEPWENATLTPEGVRAALAAVPGDRVKAMAAVVAQAGVRVWSEPPQKIGFDMQQVPLEFATFVVALQDHGVTKVLAIGDGESGGTSRFFTEVMGWHVVSIDLNEPVLNGTDAPRGWTFIQGDSHTIDLNDIPVPPGGFDAVFIDAGHEYEDAKQDWERFSAYGRVVAMHDMAPDTWFQGSRQFWLEVSRDERGNRLPNAYEVALPHSRAGIGWIVYDRPQIGAGKSVTAVTDSAPAKTAAKTAPTRSGKGKK
jgi:hypothetical protein